MKKLDDLINHLKSRFKQTPTILSYVKRYEGFKKLLSEYFEETNLPKYLPPEKLRKVTLKYYENLTKSEQELFSDMYYSFFLKEYVTSHTDPFETDFDEFKAILIEVDTNSFWNVEKDPLFETKSNKEFFNYVMQYFKDDKTLYKQRTLSYMYWRMKGIFYGKNALFIRYVNETYNDLTPLKKVLSLSVIEKEPVIEQRNVLFNKAMKNWNEENQVFKKNFNPIDCVV